VAGVITRRVGRNGPIVSALGLGCMTMSRSYGSGDDVESVATLHRARELGVTFLDTADVYGFGHNEEIIGRTVREFRSELVIGTKFGNQWDAPGGARLSGRPEWVKQACDNSLRRLGMDVIDIYTQHRVDDQVPIEETVGAMADLVRAGKVRWLGLSEAGPATIRRAHKVHPITALQTEYSLWTRDPEGEVLSTCRDLGIGFVAYSPLGRGFLTGTIASPDDLPAGDRRRKHPRFLPENIEHNRRLVDRVREVAQAKACTLPQIAIAWVLAQGDDIIPIPGARRRDHLEDNLGALNVLLTAEDLDALINAMPAGAAKGDRYPSDAMGTLNR
jgi:aryl-alcohol dehydrogenase-like predicted oxidoreductase